MFPAGLRGVVGRYGLCRITSEFVDTVEYRAHLRTRVEAGTSSGPLISIGAAIPDVENFNMLNPSRGPKLDDIALTCLHQCSRYRRYPTHLLTIEIGLVNANDGDRSLRSPPKSVGHGRAEEYLIQVLLLCRVDHLSGFQPFGQKSYSPVNLAQTAFTVNVIAIF